MLPGLFAALPVSPAAGQAPLDDGLLARGGVRRLDVLEGGEELGLETLFDRGGGATREGGDGAEVELQR